MRGRENGQGVCLWRGRPTQRVTFRRPASLSTNARDPYGAPWRHEPPLHQAASKKSLTQEFRLSRNAPEKSYDESSHRNRGQLCWLRRCTLSPSAASRRTGPCLFFPCRPDPLSVNGGAMFGSRRRATRRPRMRESAAQEGRPGSRARWGVHDATLQGRPCRPMGTAPRKDARPCGGACPGVQMPADLGGRGLPRPLRGPRSRGAPQWFRGSPGGVACRVTRRRECSLSGQASNEGAGRVTCGSCGGRASGPASHDAPIPLCRGWARWPRPRSGSKGPSCYYKAEGMAIGVLRAPIHSSQYASSGPLGGEREPQKRTSYRYAT